MEPSLLGPFLAVPGQTLSCLVLVVVAAYVLYIPVIGSCLPFILETRHDPTDRYLNVTPA
jgi:hypothetical protein